MLAGALTLSTASIYFAQTTDSLSRERNLDEVVITGVIDVVKERETPVAVSTIRASVIQEKLGNQEFPEILKTTPSVYATKTGGGYGDSRINVRGFDQRNTAVIINGQPVNDMENGWVYWSNWQGLSDIASSVQIQRGLGASKLAVPSVGGTINIVTKATDKREGGKVDIMGGNDGYVKYVASYNTGINDKGWAASFLLGRWQGNGYVNGLEGEGYTYFTSIGYKPSDAHTFGLTFTGAGQWHYQRSSWIKLSQYKQYEDEAGVDPRRLNLDAGTLNGENYSLRRNFYNKPIATFNWDWNMSDKLSLATAIYASWGRGGGTGPIGRGKMDRNADGTVNYDKVVADNRSIAPYTGPSSDYKGFLIGTNDRNLKGANSFGINSNVTLGRASMNSHDWYGAISNLSYEIDDAWTIGAGVDLRTYSGYHYRVLNDLLGLDAYYSSGENRNVNGGLFVTKTIEASPFKDTGLKSDKIDYYNIGKVNWAGLNGLIEYDKNGLSAVVQGGISSQQYQRIDEFDVPFNERESDKKSLTGGYVKGGFNFNLDDNNNIFVNAGYIARQPNFDAVFLNYGNDVNNDVENEKIKSVELGYGYRSSIFRANLNAYMTKWDNRWLTRGFTIDNVNGTANFAGIAQLHKGVELDLNVRPIRKVNLNAMVSIGDWKYTDNVTSTVFDDQQNKIGEATVYLKDVKVGDAAQFTWNVGADFEIVDGLKLDASYYSANNLYANFSPTDSAFLNPDNKGALKLPSYGLLDAGLGYTYKFTNRNSLGFRFNVNNILDETYIAEAMSNNPVTDKTTGTYNGIDDSNYVWFGTGRTWNASLTYKF